jgi:hypothetical protein
MLAELDLRIRQLHEAMSDVRTADLSTIEIQTVASEGRFYRVVDFSGGASDAELANIVSLFLTNIACLKDHLNVWCRSRNLPPPGDALINSNIDVAIIHDLWNRDKHFDLNRSRSHLFPKLQNNSRDLVMSTMGQVGSMVVMSLDPQTGQLVTQGDGKAELVVDADIIDSSGAHVGLLSEVAERAVAAWEVALTASGIPVPPRPS